MNTTFTKTITINAPVSEVWDIITNPDKINNWIFDGDTSVTSDWKVGSPILFTRKLYKGAIKDKGVLLKSEKERKFQYSHWSKISKIPDVPENYSVITFTFEPKGEKTELTLTHSNLIAEAAYEHARFYWTVTLGIIKKLAE